jgi:hypothetical protein
MQSVTEMCVQTLDTISTYQDKKKYKMWKFATMVH